jgi:uncharacterized protein (DUF427 family)
MKTGTAKATVGGTTIAETSEWEEVEGNVYFPPSSLKSEFFSGTDLHTTCPWKGEASYYTITVGGMSFDATSSTSVFFYVEVVQERMVQEIGFADDCSRLTRHDA